jgi:hypothetical protein
MTRAELEQWLCGPDAPVLSPAEIAATLGLPLGAAAAGDTTHLRVADRLLGARFTVAVLRDVFPDDRGVRGWLRAPRPALGGRSALDVLLAGRSGEVAELAADEWNAPAAPPPPGHDVPALFAGPWRPDSPECCALASEPSLHLVR